MIIDKKKLKKLFETKNQSRKRNAKTSKGKKINRSLNNRAPKNLRTGSVSRRHKTAKTQKGGIGYRPSPELMGALSELGGGPDAHIDNPDAFFVATKDRLAGELIRTIDLHEYVVPRYQGDKSGYPFFKKEDFKKVGNPGGGDCLYYSLVTALQDCFPKDPLQFSDCLPGGTERLRIPSQERMTECEKAQYQVRFLLSSYIKSSHGRSTMSRIPGFRQALISMGFNDHDAREAATTPATSGAASAESGDIEFMFNKHGTQATLIAADENIEVKDYERIPFIAAVQSGTRSATQVADWTPDNWKTICDTIADNILYNGGVFGKDINIPKEYDWGTVKRPPQQSIPEWGSEYHMELFSNLLRCRISLLCPLKPLTPGTAKGDVDTQYVALQNNMSTLAQTFVPLSPEGTLPYDEEAISQLPIIYLYYSTPALMAGGDENDTPSSHYEYLKVINMSKEKTQLSTIPEYDKLTSLALIAEANGRDPSALTDTTKEAINSVSKLMTTTKQPVGVDKRYKQIFDELKGKDGIEALVKSEPVLQTNIDEYWSKLNLTEYNHDVMRFLMHLLEEKTAQASIPPRIVQHAKEIAALRLYTETVPGLSNIRDKDYLKVIEDAEKTGKKIDINYIADNIESLTSSLKKLSGVTDASGPEPAKKGPEPGKDPVPAKKGPEPGKDPEPAKKGPEPAKDPVPAKKGPEPGKDPVPAKKGPEPGKDPVPAKKGPEPGKKGPEPAKDPVPAKKANLTKTVQEVDTALSKQKVPKSVMMNIPANKSKKPTTAIKQPVVAKKSENEKEKPSVSEKAVPKDITRDVDEGLTKVAAKPGAKVNLDTGEGLTYMKKPKNQPGASPLLEMNPPPEGFKPDPNDPYAYFKTTCEKVKIPKELKGRMGNAMGIDRKPVCYTEVINEMGAQQFLALLKFQTKRVDVSGRETMHDASDTDTSAIGTSEVGTSEVGTSKVGTSEVGTSKADPKATTSDPSKIEPGESSKQAAVEKVQQYDGNLAELVRNLHLYTWLDPANVSDNTVPDANTLKHLIGYSELGIKQETSKPKAKSTTSLKIRQMQAMEKVKERAQKIKEAKERKKESTGEKVIDLSEEDDDSSPPPQTPHAPGTSPMPSPPQTPHPPGSSPTTTGGFAMVTLPKGVKPTQITPTLSKVGDSSPEIIMIRGLPKANIKSIVLKDYSLAKIRSYYDGLDKNVNFYESKYASNILGAFLDGNGASQKGEGIGLSVGNHMKALELQGTLQGIKKNKQNKMMDASNNVITNKTAIASLFETSSGELLVINISLPNVSKAVNEEVSNSLVKLFKDNLAKDSQDIGIICFIGMENKDMQIKIEGLKSMKAEGMDTVLVTDKLNFTAGNIMKDNGIDSFTIYKK